MYARRSGQRVVRSWPLTSIVSSPPAHPLCPASYPARTLTPRRPAPRPLTAPCLRPTLCSTPHTLPAQTRAEREWSKVEERHFRSALSKHKNDLKAIRASMSLCHPSACACPGVPNPTDLQPPQAHLEAHDDDIGRDGRVAPHVHCAGEAVRTKPLTAVTRFFFVEDGLRKKAERDRRKELEILRLSRSTHKGAEGGKEGAGGGASNPMGVSPADLSRASTPFSMGALDGTADALMAEVDSAD